MENNGQNSTQNKTPSNPHECGSVHSCVNDVDIAKITKLLVIITIFMILELWGHFKTRSLSLLADALHLLVDISGFIVSIVTLRMAKKGASRKMTWGYQRVEVLGAMGSIVLIWAAVIYLIIESVHKYIHPAEIDGKVFLAIALIGLIVNLGCIFILHRHPHHSHQSTEQNLNIRATYIHVVGDVIQSVGIIIASVTIYFFPSLVIADLLCTVFFAVLVLFSTGYVVRDGIRILSEGAPPHISQQKISEYILKEEAVIKITDMKVWSIGVNRHAIALKILADHLLIREYEALLVKIQKYLEDEHFDRDCITIQIDTPKTNRDRRGLVIGGMALSQTCLNARV